jgi:hypothetical protein
MKPLPAPVVLIVYKRLEPVKAVLAAVRKVAPTKLFIIADGWRNEEEKQKCLAVREYLESAVDWPCIVYTEYAERNLGLRRRITTGLNWVFSQAEEAIILEDDCVPDLTFFRFCTELLERYRDEPRIMQISGLNTQHNNTRYTTAGASYYFSQFGEIWGWATWRRAWELNDSTMSQWPAAKANGMLKARLSKPAHVDYWEHLFDEMHDSARKTNVWGAIWVFSSLLHRGLSIVPKTNLITNLGDTPEASHFRGGDRSAEFRRPIVPMQFPLVHPPRIEINQQADLFTLEYGFKIKATLREKTLFTLKRRMPWLHAFLKRLAKAS